MTLDRARSLGYQGGSALGISASRIRGDCRPSSVDVDQVCATSAPACVREALPMFIAAQTASIPLERSSSCQGGVALESLDRDHSLVVQAAADGAALLVLAAGLHFVVLSEDGRCGACGAPEEACLVEVTAGELTVRDLVVDRASHD